MNDIYRQYVLRKEVGDFWTLSRDNQILKLVKKDPVFDIGCGIGILTEQLLERGFNVFSTDIDKRFCKYVKGINKKENVFCGNFTAMDASKLPKANTVIMADVIEHMEDDAKSIAQANKLLNKGGEIIITVPAFQFLWTKNDELMGHYRRYSRKQLKEILISNGFEIEKIAYWNALAIPPLLIAKLLKLSVPRENLSKSKFNSLLKAYFIYFENHISLPVGSHLICKAKKLRNV